MVIFLRNIVRLSVSFLMVWMFLSEFFLKKSSAAVTVSSNGVVSSIVNNSADPGVLPNIDTSNGNGFTVTGSGNALTFSEVNPGELLYNGESSIISGSESNGNNSQNFATTVTQTVVFSLGVNGVVDITLQGDFSLGSAVLTSGVSWQLSGPSGGLLFSGGDALTAAVTGDEEVRTGLISESITGVSGEGNYTLILITSVTGDTNFRGVDLGSASFSDIEFLVTVVPEPSGYSLLMSSLTMLLLVRRR